MKHCILLLAILVSNVAIAQKEAPLSGSEKGEMEAGVMLGVGVGNSLGGYIRATPYTQYFLSNNWVLRLEGRYSTNGLGASQDQYAGVGLSSKYYLLRKSKLSVYGQLGYFYGQTAKGMYRNAWQSPPSELLRIERYTARLNYGMVNVGLGADYKLGSKWYIYALGEGNIKSKSSTVPTDRYNLNLGIGFRIK
ncbi:hypothetical protein [Dyadobacter sp. CY347]|uniref:hypothetical protein n=1 Tax=Dyadobacter sp. CY347 TaxID=2909336 RepID=UPI001F1E2731|nr:hypothetical protein [Dyadobacter sp. CY347]MCF2489253.1 hypothetical protein [Dyadobacter sp. CY347]